MNEYMTCKLCHAHKKVMGMGGMEIKCPECDGKGFVPKPVDMAEVIKHQAKLDKIRRKKERRLRRNLHQIGDNHPLSKMDNKVNTEL